MAAQHETAADAGDLAHGDRVRMNSFGLERHPSYGAREGVIVGMGTRNSLRIKFDDRITVQAIHRNYLERVPGTGLARALRSVQAGIAT